jgi:peptidoglycan hydrolase FlgJ
MPDQRSSFAHRKGRAAIQGEPALAVALVTDLVMDVLKAAAPDDVEAARARLAGISGSASVAADRFETALAAVGSGDGREAQIRETAQKFEAVVLQGFLKSMLPDEAESVFGKGMSGEMWKSLMAEKIADVVAERGGIGIADRFVADRYREGERVVPLTGVDRSPERADADRRALMSTALLHEMQRLAVSAPDRAADEGRA